jgi:hypothetical protein
MKGDLVKNSKFVPAFVKARAYRASAREQQKIQRFAMQKIRRGNKISDKANEMGDRAVSGDIGSAELRRQKHLYNKGFKIQGQVYKKYGYSGDVARIQKKLDLEAEKDWNRRAEEQRPYLIAGGVAGGSLLGGAAYLAMRNTQLSAKLRLRELAYGRAL